MAELKPCPLCGENNLLSGVEYIPKKWAGGFNVGFVECLTEGCSMIIRAPTLEIAETKWNKRPLESKYFEKITYLQAAYNEIYKAMAYMKFIQDNMETSPEKDKMIVHTISKILEKQDNNG